MSRAAVPAERIENRILALRGHKVLLDTDLAALYTVETRSLVQAVKRNLERFPEDFMFHLNGEEHETLRSQSVIGVNSTTKCDNTQHESRRLLGVAYP